ncbi:DUF4434 domain-containing protein [Pseudopedobacter beijingensis]|uniref:DUF4434 domain-containing protein n=1 Tax=Pseudopedobacter beijingensis TaxID=1207056 RepID=A0ABW4IBV0_9SPHI
MKMWINIIVITLLTLGCSFAQTTKQVKGTWVNLPYQDVRNKYMNPKHVNYTDPLFWHTKIKEYAEMGLSYIVIMAVANEEKSFYPSQFMALAYPQGQESPVEAIMNAADKYGMNVFMSCGWAINQDDDIRRPEIKVIQQKIMRETAELFSKHKSFYGWYLPVEDSLSPVLPDQSVEAVNTLTETAKSLTPNAKIMISPYGIWNADIRNRKFADQIKKLKVDIIAYQDEVGCVREPFPIKRVKENFQILGQIHKETKIEFWANVESFTWEKEDNSRESALVPAAFSRYLSQIVGASMSGAKEIVSFSIYGIMDKSTSEMPIGQPIGSAKFYSDYTDWQNGIGRWPLLEKTFMGNVNNLATGKYVKFNTLPSSKINKGKLTDNSYGYEDPSDSNWLSFENGIMNFEVDLKKIINIKSIAVRFLHYRKENVLLPNIVDFYVSSDGRKFKKAKTIAMEASPNDRHDSWIDIAMVGDLNETARFIKIIAEGDKDGQILSDEVLVNPVF